MDVGMGADYRRYSAKLWRFADGSWSLISVEVEGGKRRVLSSVAKGACFDVLFRAEHIALDLIAQETIDG
ncbi:hypothetical protein CXG43_09275 [Stenotrophomonas sp. Bg11-02]|nr:hypothetical protein CXF90_15060 [Stenotrophomonas sp. Betaine-02u-23]PKH96063.1 hypothetical protein CXG43_09275 [Stenotrophomonas sp. Bg11-02]